MLIENQMNKERAEKEKIRERENDVQA